MMVRYLLIRYDTQDDTEKAGLVYSKSYQPVKK
jgi:hypothetical protein